MRVRLLTVACVLAAAVPAHAIVGGAPVSSPYPAMAQLFVEGSFSCGATLVRAQWVLTAAHCVEGTEPADLQIRLGRQRLSDTGGEEIAVGQTIIHEGWNGNSYDAALLRLARPSTLAPARVVSTAERDRWRPGVRATVVGWGATSTQGGQAGQASNELREVQVSIVDDDNCEVSANSTIGFDRATQVCAGEPEGGKDSCQGDSGGPLFAPDAGGALVLVGVVSGGVGCGVPLAYGVYSRIGENPLNAWVALHLPAAPAGTAPTPAPGQPAPTPTVTPGAASNARIHIARDLGSAKVANRRKRFRLRLRTSATVTGIRVKVVCARKLVATGRVARVSSRTTLALRPKRRVKRGNCSVGITATDASGRTMRVAGSARFS